MSVTFRVFKKCSSDGKVTVYLGRRDFIDHVTCSDPIDGVIHIDREFINDKKLIVQLICTFRYGREEDETMGLSFKKELVLREIQLFPPNNENDEQQTRLQERLLSKLGKNSFPFHLEFPQHSPTSVTLCTGPTNDPDPCGVEYFVRAQLISAVDKNKIAGVNMVVRKIQYAPTKPGRQPSTVVRKDFALSPGELELEATLDRQLYHHGDMVKVNVCVRNNSGKTVKKIVVSVIQCIDVAMFTGGHSTTRICRIESLDGCPITPGSSLQREYTLYPNAKNINANYGVGKHPVALDGRLRGDDTSLASSTLLADENNKDIFGLVISYSVKVKLLMGAISGELTAELPFVLMHPKPDMRRMMKADTLDINSFEDDDNVVNKVDMNLLDLGSGNKGTSMQMGPLRRRNVNN